jgi:hypothetical protein
MHGILDRNPRDGFAILFLFRRVDPVSRGINSEAGRLRQDVDEDCGGGAQTQHRWVLRAVFAPIRRAPFWRQGF